MAREEQKEGPCASPGDGRSNIPSVDVAVTDTPPRRFFKGHCGSMISSNQTATLN